MTFEETKEESRLACLGAIMEHADAIREQAKSCGLQPVRLLKAICHCESSCGVHLDPGTHRIASRFEPSYAPGGKYHNVGQWDRWGIPAASSHGPMQLMYATAILEGYAEDTDPLDDAEGLHRPDVGIRLGVLHVGRLLDRLLAYRDTEAGRRDQRQELELVLDAYNSGSFAGFRPVEYVRRGSKEYGRHTEGARHP